MFSKNLHYLISTLTITHFKVNNYKQITFMIGTYCSRCQNVNKTKLPYLRVEL